MKGKRNLPEGTLSTYSRNQQKSRSLKNNQDERSVKGSSLKRVHKLSSMWPREYGRSPPQRYILISLFVL